jgi:hypothetical protein
MPEASRRRPSVEPNPRRTGLPTARPQLARDGDVEARIAATEMLNERSCLPKRSRIRSNLSMEMPIRFIDDDYTPRLWAELYPVLRHIKTDDLVAKILAYKGKSVRNWRADDWGLLDALNKMLTLRASSRHHALKNDSPSVRDAAFWATVDKELEFYYNAEYPGKELHDD